MAADVKLLDNSKCCCLFCSRCEIEATLDRLKKLERDLSTKEQELKERERRLKMWERKLIEQSCTPVSRSLCCVHSDPPSTASAAHFTKSLNGQFKRFSFFVYCTF